MTARRRTLAVVQHASDRADRADAWNHRSDAEPRSTGNVAHLWLEHCRRQLGQPRLGEDEFERLGHQAVQTDGQLPLDDDPEF